ncbi:MAG: T9SS type A sorting domain-containing protein, partial [Flavobacteriales bacterium]|nr:T9SS type A sorting domain-containing protein [Flavobacteriales bacterium]
AVLPITAQDSTLVTWTYDDGHGNTSTQIQYVIINDVTAPVADAGSLADVTDECSVTSLTPPTATDNCVGSVNGTHDAVLPITAQDSTLVTWTYDDGHGNTSTQVQYVIINDVTAPVPNAGSLADVNAECSVISLSLPTATDNCVGTVYGTHDATLPITTQGTTVVTWTYDDGHGNTSTQTQNVVIADVTAPVANAGSLADITDECSVTSLTPPTATDNCVGSVNGTHDAMLPITAQDSTLVTWTYDDGHGNTSTQIQYVIINDITAPVADAGSLADVTDECSVTSLTAPTATDNCVGSVNGTHDATLPITTQGTTVVTWTYDDGHGNTSTQTQNVVITDATAPVADAGSLADVTDDCEVTSLTPPTATDNCVGLVNGTHNATLPITTLGTTVVTWTYDDGHGNTSTQTQNVVITDATAPVADAGSLADVTDDCEVASLTPPTATDNCLGSVNGTHDATLPITTLGTTVVTWTYDDGHGNTSTQMQNVIINGIDVSVVVTDPVITANNTGADAYQWIDCNNGNAPVSGETASTFTATVNGTYAVVITQGSCSDTSTCEVILNVGVTPGSGQSTGIAIYPNPSDGSFTVDLGTEHNTRLIRIMDVLGSLVYEFPVSNETVVDIRLNQPPGVYFVNVVDENNGIRVQRLIIGR